MIIENPALNQTTSSPLLTGLDRLVEDPHCTTLVSLLKSARIALLAHPASVTRNLTHISQVFRELQIKPVRIFGPEHGYGGEAQDMIGVEDAKDRSGIPVKSLYGDSFEKLIPTEDDLRDIDIVVCDLQDIGSRYYTFIWTAVLTLRACAKYNKRMIVLDRPNPLGGLVLEGRPVEPEFRSFVGLENLPIRHGLTLGEVVAWRAKEESLSKSLLEVVRVKNWDRSLHATSWQQPWVYPSPNMPTYTTALVYPGGCLLEGTNLSEGRGTTRPFEVFGAPFLDGERLASRLRETNLTGFIARPLSFQPSFHKHAGKICGGVQIHVTDPTLFRPVACYAALIALAYQEAPDLFQFRTERYEFIDHIPAFDLLTGNAETRKAILQGEKASRIAEQVSHFSKEEYRRMVALRLTSG